MSSAPSPQEIAIDATWLAQALDPNAGTVRLVAMNRDSYRAASFLDDRLLQSTIDAQLVSWPDVEAAVSGDLRDDARWIFHIGHVGSTLVSRLVGELDGVLSIREPRLLRDVALCPEAIRDRYIAPTAKLMSRTFAEQELACVKATSFASEIASELVPPGRRALFMYARPSNYIASILAGENSVKELHALSDYRGRRLAARDITFPSPRNDSDRAAMAWACEMTTLQAADAAMPDQVAWADFDKMLGDMPAELGRIASFFGFGADPARLEALADGPLMNRYSKDPNYEYSANLRAQLIEQEIGFQRADIAGALAMLRSAAEKSELLARALDRAGGI